MIELAIQNITHGFEVGSNVLDGVTFQVDSGERVGLLGANGAGKTTLFRVITGELIPDEGSVSIAKGHRVGLISQIPVYPAGFTVEAVLRSAFQRLQEMERELTQLSETMGADPDRATLARYDQLAAAFAHGGGYDTEIALNKVAAGLGISAAQRTQLFDALSGGEKTRVNLARLILEDTDLLLLDEPTNHLDLHATEWLEEYLARFKGTVLAISHDRYFLDKVVDRVIELDNGKAEFYAGNYSFFVTEKEARYQEKLRQYEKEQAKIAQLEAAAQQMRLWAFMGNDKQYKRAVNMERRIERMRVTDKPTRQRALQAQFDAREFHGDEVFSTIDLSKSFGDRLLFDHVNLVVAGGERIALLGDNGTGKSTFLKLLLGEEAPTTGKIRFGPTVRVGYLPQQVVFDHPERNLVDTMLYATNCNVQEARDRLASFLFRGDEVFKEVGALSGGEKSRLRLCILMHQQINLLILDEPTNHLDIASREWIEGAIDRFDGALLLVSHDRYFINRFAGRIWTLQDRRIEDFRGDYQDYVNHLNKKTPAPKPAPAPVPAEAAPAQKPRRGGGTKQLEKEVAAAERAVEKAEIRLDELSQAVEEAASDYLKLQALYEEREALEDELARLYAQWERLAAELEEARG